MIASNGTLCQEVVFAPTLSSDELASSSVMRNVLRPPNPNILLLAAIALLSLCSGANSASDAERRPNVVFFLVDDLGWSDLGCYGSRFYETPNIDRFAEQGVRFTQAYAACHVCSPARASILTGKYPARLQLTDWLTGRPDYPFQKLKNAEIHQHLPLEETTLAETLRNHGYRTAHIGKWHLGEEPFGPRQQGFDIQIPRWNKGWPKAGYHAPFQLDGLGERDGDYLTDRLTDEAEQFIEANMDQPFFLYLSHFAVHDPIQGRSDLVEKYCRKLADQQSPDSPEFILEGNPDDPEPRSRKALHDLSQQPTHRGYKVLPRRTVKIKQRQDNVEFAAMVEAMDQSLGRVLDKLGSLGLSEHTIVIFFSDNGGMSAANFFRPERIVAEDELDAAFSTSNLPLRGGKGWLYEGGIRVPMIVRWPGYGTPGTVCDEPVISTDFYPSLLEMLGLPAMPHQAVDGISFAAAVKGDPFDRGAIFWHFPHYSNHGMQSPGSAVRVGDYKLLEYFENSTVQLFNLRTDVAEEDDLSRVEPDKTAELRSLLQAWRKNVSARMMEPNPEYVDGRSPWD